MTILVIILFLICFEIIIRIAGIEKLKYITDDDLYWKLKPNQYGTPFYGLTKASVNSDGFRGKEQNRSTGKKILVLGSSRVFGWGVKDDETFPYLLEKRINSRNNSEKYQVINAAVPGYGLYQQMVFLEKNIQKIKPNIVIYSFGDANLQFRKIQNKAKEERYLKIAKFRDNFAGYESWNYVKYMLMKFFAPTKLQPANFIEDNDITSIWNSEKKHLKQIIQITKDANSELIIQVFPNNIIKAEDFIKMVNKDINESLIDDLPTYLATYKIEELKLSNDGHPSRMVYKIIAGRIYAELLTRDLLS